MHLPEMRWGNGNAVASAGSAFTGVGADSKFETRKTGREPTKSGVIGLLAAALGLRRDEREALLRLTGLRFGVRVEREGQLLVDYHTAKTQDEKTSYVTYRHYLQDAVFLAGIESTDTALLQQLQQALLHPAFPLYLGRRSCPPHPAALSGTAAMFFAGSTADRTAAVSGTALAAGDGCRPAGAEHGSAAGCAGEL